MLKTNWSKKNRNCFNEREPFIKKKKSGEERLLTPSICNQEEMRVYMEFYLRFLKVLSYSIPEAEVGRPGWKAMSHETL